jgi:hypothetical protein
MGARLLEKAIAFSSCVGLFRKSGSGETPQVRSDEEAPEPPKKNLPLKKPA